ncbi:MAG: hypothetical protein DI563_01960 [Variovorax paradoxus]|uniref:Uncharacterized protein n=1 Tax=Variovorax paradoxus TaxID=34073 RepID=A0A2W5S5B9_VARPD|nr:MAG: hypothetical protein DI563_01960 [Variovorax paradoxus]
MEDSSIRNIAGVDYIYAWDDGQMVRVPMSQVASSGVLTTAPRLLHAVGDSIAALNLVTVGNSTDYDARGPLVNAMVVSGGQVQIGQVLGLNGQGTAAINAALPAFLSGLPANSLVNYHPGANDSAATAAATIANITAGVALIQNAGHTVILCTILPNSAWLASAALDLKRIQVNNGTRRLAATLRAAGKPVILVDWDHLPFTTSTNDTLTITTGFFTDGTHPGQFGAEQLGIFWWNAVKVFMPAMNPFAPFANMGSRFANPFMEPTAAGGGTPTGITVNAVSAGTGAATSNQRRRNTTTGGPEWLEYTVTFPNGGGNVGGYASLQTSASLTGGAGNGVSFCALVEIDVPDGSSLIECKLRLQNFAANKIRRCMMQPVNAPGSADASSYLSAGTKRWFMRTPPVDLDAADAASSTVAYIDLMGAAAKTVTVRTTNWIDVPVLAA